MLWLISINQKVFFLDEQYDYFFDYVEIEGLKILIKFNFFIYSRRLNDQDKFYCYEYLRQRFGYYFENFAFKGFLFNDINIKLCESYENGPEFLGYLFLFLDNDQIIDDFYKQSHFYKLKYLVPINKIYFEDFDELDDLAKQKHLIVWCLQRLYFDK